MAKLRHATKTPGKLDVLAKATKGRRTHLTLSFVALILAIVTMISTTFAWYTAKDATLEFLNYSLDCTKGLRVNDSGTSDLHFNTVNKYLIPASSVDGRNLFFPTDGSDFSSTTSQMTFRSSTVGDKNFNYIQIDASLTAQQNHTAIYIDDTLVDDNGESKPKTRLEVKRDGEPDSQFSTTKAAPLRMAIWASTNEDGSPNTPVVFNPLDRTVTSAAVADVDRTTGAYIANSPQTAHAFSEYAFGGKPIATLSKGVETKIKIIIWLEGTDPKCTDKVKDSDISLHLAFTTSWDKTQTIRFKDETTGGKVQELLSQKYSLELHYENSTDATDVTDFNMYKYHESTDEWACNIPGDMTNKITFKLRPPTSNSEAPTYTFCVDYYDHSKFTYDRGANRQYIAKQLNTSSVGSCTGYWRPLGDSDGGGHDSGGNGDGDDF